MIATGQVVGRYTVLGPLAKGGMAEVFLARMSGSAGFKRTVVIKKVLAQFASDPSALNMLLDEARLASRVSHPNVVQTIDVVADHDEIFIVLDYVAGETLHRLLRLSGERQQLVPIDVVVGIVTGALRGLHAAHEACDEKGEPLDLVHRDLSPQNIMVDGSGIARVLDFGIAKARGRLQETQTGTLKGKLAYMAPEQIHGQTSRASDVFAMGVVLWEALTMKRLFRGENEAAVLAAVLRCEVPFIGRERPSVPPAVIAVCERALSMDPAARYASADEMADALERSGVCATQTRVGQWVRETAATSLAERRSQVEELEAAVEATEQRARFTKRSLQLAAGMLLVALALVVTAVLTRRAPSQASPDFDPRGQVGRQSDSTPRRPSLDQPSMDQPSMDQPSPNQPSPNQPSPNQPSPNQPSLAQPSLAQPSPNQPSPNQPSPDQPSLAQPSLAQPSPNQPSPAQPSLAQPSPNRPAPTFAAADPPPEVNAPAPDAGARPARLRTPTVSTKRKDPCSPPWEIDADGYKKYKRECFP